MVTVDDRLEIAQQEIETYFDGLPKKTFVRADLKDVLNKFRDVWRLTSTCGREVFIRFLREKSRLIEHRLDFPNGRRILFTWGEAPLWQVLMALDSRVYACHYSAMFLHNLTVQIPKTLYFNIEQTPKRSQGGDLSQERIDMAFNRAQRLSKNIAEYGGYRLCLLNGKNTGDLGVSEVVSEDEAIVRVTNIERTLIDIAVRPAYAGGVEQVLQAYQLARDKASINRIVATLKKLDYVYPYHQTIGFYLEHAGGYNLRALNLLRDIDQPFDFYLAHGMKDKSYDRNWRLYYPAGLKSHA